MWRVMPGVGAALFIVALASVTIYWAESSRGAAARAFGYEGEETWRVIAITSPDTDEVRLSEALADFCDDQNAAMGFSSGDSGVITLYDPNGQFAHAGADLYEPLAAAGSQPAALLSTAVAVEESERAAVVREGVELVGTFDPLTQFDGVYPVLIQNLAAGPVRSGVFRFVGLTSGDEAAVEAAFVAERAEIIRVDIEERVSFVDFWATVLGRLVVLFTLVSLVTTTLIVVAYMSLSRARLQVASLCGATAGDLRRLVLRRLVPLMGLGLLAGLACISLAVLSFRDAMLTGPATIASAFGVAVGICCAALVVIVACVAWWQGRTLGRALPR